MEVRARDASDLSEFERNPRQLDRERPGRKTHSHGDDDSRYVYEKMKDISGVWVDYASSRFLLCVAIRHLQRKVQRAGDQIECCVSGSESLPSLQWGRFTPGVRI